MSLIELSVINRTIQSHSFILHQIFSLFFPHLFQIKTIPHVGKNLNFYIKKSYSPIPKDPVPEIPEPYCSLLKMQNVAGKWQSLKNVLLCLDMPAVFTLVEYSDWEVATGTYVRAFTS